MKSCARAVPALAGVGSSRLFGMNPWRQRIKIMHSLDAGARKAPQSAAHRRLSNSSRSNSGTIGHAPPILYATARHEADPATRQLYTNAGPELAFPDPTAGAGRPSIEKRATPRLNLGDL